MLSVVVDEAAQAELGVDLDALAREGARRMLAAALEAEVDDYLAAHAAERDEGGRRLVVRNGHARQREVLTAAGAVAVRAPRVDDRRTDPVTGQRARFRSVILPPWCRKSPKVCEVLPLLYLHGLSTGDFVPALEEFFGSAAGLSAAAVGRLLAGWQADHQAFSRRDLADRDYVYCWADGVHFRVRLEQARLCCLVIVGVRADGSKELVAVADGERESTESWAELLRDLRRRGMRAPVVMVGDGALGLWAALRDVFPATRASATGSIRSPLTGPRDGGQAFGVSGSALSRRRWPWRLSATRWCRAASACQPLVWASSWRALTSASWAWSAGMNSGAGW